MPEQLVAMAPMLIFLVVAYGAMYLLMIRPQQQEQKRRLQMLKELKKGDRVVTVGGVYGWVVAIAEDKIKLKFAEKVEVDVERGAVVRLASDQAKEP